MAKKTAGYKEPAGYFSKSMLEEADKWDREHPGKKPTVKRPAAKKPATGKKKK